MEKKTSKIIDSVYEVRKTLGEGATSVVFEAKDTKSGKKLAVKIYKEYNKRKLLEENFKNEVEVIQNVKHENIVNLITYNLKGVLENKGKKENIMYLGLELAENHQLFDYIAPPNTNFNEIFTRAIFKQILDGLEAFHSNKIAHRDLKTENIFLNKIFGLKIGDFGFCKHVDKSLLTTQLGTKGYQSPELVKGLEYSGEANDLFACGVILFIISCGYPPFKEASKIDPWYRNIYDKSYESFWKMHKNINLSKDLKDLIIGLLKYDSKERYTFVNIKSHSFFYGDYPTNEEYISEMKERKKIFDEERKKETELVNLNKAENDIGQFRDMDEDTLISINNTLNESSDKFAAIESWDSDELPKYFINFEKTKQVNIYKYLITIILEENGKITLSDNRYSLEAVIPFFSESEETEQNETKIKFELKLYSDSEEKNIYAVFLKDDEVDSFEFKKFFYFFKSKL